MIQGLRKKVLPNVEDRTLTVRPSVLLRTSFIVYIAPTSHHYRRPVSINETV